MQEHSLAGPAFHFHRESSWPPLAWLAICRDGQAEILVRHGPDVEIRPEWFCEAVWDGDFASGSMDRTENVFGSGARIREGGVTFISSLATCDRLQYFRSGDAWYVSNSLACLSGVLDLRFDPWYPWYYEDFASICEGVDNYKSDLRSDRGEVQLVYHRNLAWNGHELQVVEKPTAAQALTDFVSYREFLETILKRLAANACASQRRITYAPISTCSSGYDSSAVTVLSRTMENREAICVPSDRMDRNDSGIELVRRLRMRPVVVARDAWRRVPFAEVPFVAGDACGRDVWIAGAQEHLRSRLLLTGQRGGPPWRCPPTRHDADFGRDDPGGLSLTEYRLMVGFLHCPVPMLGTRATDRIHAISASGEMQPWRLGGDYDRPIARRIIEDAGIKRSTFATRKTATAVHLFRRVDFDRYMPGTPSFKDYLRWMREQSRINSPPETAPGLRVPSRENIEVPLFHHFFPWALERHKQVYGA